MPPKVFKKKKVFVISPTIISKATRSMLFLPSCTTITRRVALYFPYRKILSTYTNYFQQGNPSTRGLKV